MSEELARELRAIAEELKEQAAIGEQPEVAEPLTQVADAAVEFGKAWSGSNMGYHAHVYYADFEVPPPGAHFDSEWGFRGQLQGTMGDWREYRSDHVIALVYERAGVASLDDAADRALEARSAWTNARPEIGSILRTYLAQAEAH